MAPTTLLWRRLHPFLGKNEPKRSHSCPTQTSLRPPDETNRFPGRGGEQKLLVSALQPSKTWPRSLFWPTTFKLMRDDCHNWPIIGKDISSRLQNPLYDRDAVQIQLFDPDRRPAPVRSQRTPQMHLYVNLNTCVFAVSKCTITPFELLAHTTRGHFKHRTASFLIRPLYTPCKRCTHT